MAKTTLRDGAARLAQGFPPLDGPNGSRWLYAMTIISDAEDVAVKQAVQARMPGVGTPTALPIIGQDRRINRGLDEPDDSYARRLSLAFDTWRHAGSDRGVLGQLLAYLEFATPDPILMRIVSDSGVWNTLDPSAGQAAGDVPTRIASSPNNWDWDGASAWWRFWAIIYPPSTLWTDDGTWNDPGTWDDGGVWDSTATPNEIASLRALVHDWKSKHAWCRWILLAFDGSWYSPGGARDGFDMPDGAWGRWSRYDVGTQTQVAARPDSTSFIDGTPYQVVRGGAGSIIDTIGA